MRKAKVFAIYIMTNNQRSHVLYTGVTGNLGRRILEHKNETVTGFTSRYNLHRLVYYENFASSLPAIEREKEIKSWRRNKKIALIESMNPHWYDLAASWAKPDKPQQLGTARKIPLSA